MATTASCGALAASVASKCVRASTLAAAAVLITFTIAAPADADAITFSDVIVFGDSLSDNGNLYELTGGFVPISPPYYEGRFSNGPVWVELLAPQLGVNAETMTNYAIGGSTTMDVFDVQIAEHASLGSTPTDALHIFWAGANDFLGSSPGDAIEPLISNAISNIEASITALAALGGETFLMANLPDLALTPRYVNDEPGDAGRAHAYSVAFNDALDMLIADLASELSIDVFTLDVFGVMNEIVADPESYGFENVTDRALLTTGFVVDDPDSYLFWDDVHPTAPAHLLLADYAAAAIPVPGMLPLLGLWIMAVRPRRPQGA